MQLYGMEVPEDPRRKLPRSKTRNARYYTKPTHARLTIRLGKDEASWVMPVPEAAYIARLVESIFTGREERLFRLDEKVTFARFERVGKVEITLKEVR